MKSQYKAFLASVCLLSAFPAFAQNAAEDKNLLDTLDASSYGDDAWWAPQGSSLTKVESVHRLKKEGGKDKDRHNVNTGNAIGKPQLLAQGAPDILKSFVSLGWGRDEKDQLLDLIIHFKNNVLMDVEGDDLHIFEVGKAEAAKIWISKDGLEWIYVDEAKPSTNKAPLSFDIGKVEGVGPDDKFTYVRLRDATGESTNAHGTIGADIDAIAAIGSKPAIDGVLLTELSSCTCDSRHPYIELLEAGATTYEGSWKWDDSKPESKAKNIKSEVTIRAISHGFDYYYSSSLGGRGMGTNAVARDVESGPGFYSIRHTEGNGDRFLFIWTDLDTMTAKFWDKGDPEANPAATGTFRRKP